MSRSAAIASLREGRSWMTNAALCVIGCGLLLLSREFVQQHSHYTIGLSGVSGWSVWLYLAAIVIVMTQPADRATLGIILGFAVAFRAFPYFAPPFLSSDIYRYVWDGIVQHAHINPYRYVPGDAALTFLRAPHQTIFDNINRRDYAHTIYPPMAQLIYWAVTFFSPTVAAMKLAMFGFECVTAGALLAMLRRLERCREEVLLYAWCPLLVWEIGDAGHIDAAVFAFVTLALLFRLRGRPVLTGVFLGAAILTKFYPLVLFPALYQRRDWKMPATIAAMSAAAYAIYSSVGMGVFGFLGGYEKEEGIDSGARYFLLDLTKSFHALRDTPKDAYLIFCVAVMGALTVWAWRKATIERPELARVSAPAQSTQMQGRSAAAAASTPVFLRIALAFALALMLLFSPHYAWYIAWLVPFLVLVPNLPLLVYITAFFYLYTTSLGEPGPKMFLLNKILYGAVAAAWLAQVLLRRWPMGRWFVSLQRRYHDGMREGLSGGEGS